MFLDQIIEEVTTFNFEFYPHIHPLVKSNSVYITRMGSYVYGASSADSDTDLYAVIVPPAHHILPALNKYIGFGPKPPSFDTWQKADLESTSATPLPSLDVSAYNIVKYFQLVADANPNMVDSLFVPEKHWVYASNFWFDVYHNRHLFLSKAIFPRYYGYATSNTKKLQDRQATGKRKATIEQYGYDIKAAYHLYRLMSEALEMAETGTLTLEDDHRSQVMRNIRAGEYTLDEFQLGMRVLEDKFKDAETKSTLPDSVDWNELNYLLWTTLDKAYGGKEWCRV